MYLLTAPTNLGNRPYESDGTARWTTLGPQRLRDAGVVQRLGAHDLGDIAALPYRDFVREPGKLRNEDLVHEHNSRIARALEPLDDFVLLLGGDCSVLLGALAGLKRGRELGLVFLDGHSDFNTRESTQTGGIAGMDLKLATESLVREEHVVAMGVRDGDFTNTRIHTASSGEEALRILGDRAFFIHVDVDVLDPELMPFVDSPEPGGLTPEQLIGILAPLMNHPNAVGMELTIYDPRDDADGRGAELLVHILEQARYGKFANRGAAAEVGSLAS